MNVLQSWVTDLTFMQQGVLLAAVRGPDGLRKDHVAKLLLRWYRRCILVDAFSGGVMTTPWESGGGSFTGPSVRVPQSNFGEGFTGPYQESMHQIVTDYLKHVDEMPHHFQLHLMHAAEILGYEHVLVHIREFWYRTYLRIVSDMHLNAESEVQMRFRLGDNERNWRQAEAGVTATGPVDA